MIISVCHNNRFLLNSDSNNSTSDKTHGVNLFSSLTSSVTWASLECHAMFKAFTAGIVSQRSKVYNPFGYGTPLLPLGILFLGFADDLGLDPRLVQKSYSRVESDS